MSRISGRWRGGCAGEGDAGTLPADAAGARLHRWLPLQHGPLRSAADAPIWRQDRSYRRTVGRGGLRQVVAGEIGTAARGSGQEGGALMSFDAVAVRASLVEKS